MLIQWKFWKLYGGNLHLSKYAQLGGNIIKQGRSDLSSEEIRDNE